jgi:hypothetical protein
MQYELINLRVSEAAKQLLLRDISAITEYVAIVTISWGLEYSFGKDGNPKEPSEGWSVGFYDTKDVPLDGIQEISGIKFVFNQGPISSRLNGKVLDAQNGNIVVRDAD